MKSEHIFEINGYRNVNNECFLCKTDESDKDEFDCHPLFMHMKPIIKSGAYTYYQNKCIKCKGNSKYNSLFGYKLVNNIYYCIYYNAFKSNMYNSNDFDDADFVVLIGCKMSDDEWDVKQILE